MASRREGEVKEEDMLLACPHGYLNLLQARPDSQPKGGAAWCLRPVCFEEAKRLIIELGDLPGNPFLGVDISKLAKPLRKVYEKGSDLVGPSGSSLVGDEVERQ